MNSIKAIMKIVFVHFNTNIMTNTEGVEKDCEENFHSSASNFIE